MNKVGGLQVAVTCLLMVCAGVFYWTCAVQEIGEREPSPVPINDIVSDLVTVQTQEQTEFVLNLLLNKTGIGVPIKGSKYSDYNIPEDLVPDIAQTHLKTLSDPELRLSWFEVFELEQILPEGDWIAPVTFDEVLRTFKEHAESAMQNREAPNNALVLAILADETGRVPKAVPNLTGEELLLGFQDFLLTVWIHHEFQSSTDLQKSTTDDDEKIKRIIVECEDDEPDEIDDIDKDKFKIKVFSKNHEICLEAGERMYKRLVKKVCLRKKKKKDCTTEILPCMDDANSFLDFWIETVCVQHILHDQGGGD